MPTAKRAASAAPRKPKKTVSAAEAQAMEDAPMPTAPKRNAAPNAPMYKYAPTPFEDASLRRLEWLTLGLCIVLAVITMKTTAHAGVVAQQVRGMKISLHNAALQRMHLYSVRRHEQDQKESVPAKPKPQVLTSVVRFREGEEAMLQNKLVGPMLSYYELAGGPHLTAVLIERKNAGSTNVGVREFFDDGSERDYLWPNTNAINGVWAANCVEDAAEIDLENPVLCPDGYILPVEGEELE